MTNNQLVRVGIMAQVGRFRSVDGIRLPRGSRAIVRTARGLEVGEVLGDDGSKLCDGELLRAMTDADTLLERRLQKNRNAAFEACAARLLECGSESILLDVEQLFDGRGIYFYFLGEADPLAERLTAELAAAYESEARLQQFAETLESGCGPGCGTEAATGGGCSSCGSCAIAGACGKG